MPNFDLTFRFVDGSQQKKIPLTDEQLKGTFKNLIKSVATKILPNEQPDYKRWNYINSGKALVLDNPLEKQGLNSENCTIVCALKRNPNIIKTLNFIFPIGVKKEIKITMKAFEEEKFGVLMERLAKVVLPENYSKYYNWLYVNNGKVIRLDKTLEYQGFDDSEPSDIMCVPEENIREGTRASFMDNIELGLKNIKNSYMFSFDEIITILNWYLKQLQKHK
jgi:hypothetical protein